MGGDTQNRARRRNYLFLQGPIGLFFSRLARRLRCAGHGVYRINFHGGDRLFWSLPGALDFRGDTAEWPEFLSAYLERWKITDLVLFGDCRPVHRAALSVATDRRIATHVFEEGYLRPNWITLESGGVNGNSRLSRDPQYYLRAAKALPSVESVVPITHSVARRAAEAVLYHTTMVATKAYYRGYRTHRPWHPYVEYAHTASRYLRRPFSMRRAEQVADLVAHQSLPYFLFPLQLDSDMQIRHHSPFGRMQPAVETVVDSFARHAPSDALLVITEHPLENGIVDLRQIAWRRAWQAGIDSRLVYLECGTPPNLLEGCRAVITVNSTFGFQALTSGVPVIALGEALYGLPGLTFEGNLDDFWRHGTPADPVLYDAFRRVVKDRTQINGGFYSASGISLAVERATQRMQETLDPQRREREDEPQILVM